MWTCPNCTQEFLRDNQSHSCNDRTVDSFLKGKSANVISLFHYFINTYNSIGKIALHPAKHRIAFVAKTRFGYIHRIGKEYIDFVLHFQQAYEDNLCFHKIANVPGTSTHNHYVRIYSEDDLNDEVLSYMKLAYDIDMQREAK